MGQGFHDDNWHIDKSCAKKSPSISENRKKYMYIFVQVNRKRKNENSRQELCLRRGFY